MLFDLLLIGSVFTVCQDKWLLGQPFLYTQKILFNDSLTESEVVLMVKFINNLIAVFLLKKKIQAHGRITPLQAWIITSKPALRGSIDKLDRRSMNGETSFFLSLCLCWCFDSEATKCEWFHKPQAEVVTVPFCPTAVRLQELSMIACGHWRTGNSSRTVCEKSGWPL
jgi:hypothetical protein